ncbi:helix-turn-helix transcriptional regulator [Agromyces bauzanensis]|uniref:Transcriptional regulator n=1 Tax=Agromyces bauzanensis TaxID=1308924 RepID=A0A917UXI6_9MICO|nr:helix-turn-helix transcriptional regulator [Agromyces bauzanensis]GGJ93276.1 transcriptional regulator [Agromyces bauzanensis]
MSENRFGVLLRTHREALAPEDAGIPRGPRRRTSGLRRAELATLAGVSAEYLTRLEQGRDRNPSPQVLGALADVLRLAPADRRDLLVAAKSSSGVRVACLVDAPTTDVRPTVRDLLGRLAPSPAALVNRVGDVLAATGAYRRMLEPFGLFDDDHPNLPRFVFAEPRARAAFPDWGRIADREVAALRRETGPADEFALEFAATMADVAAAEFTERYRAVRTTGDTGARERLRHPEVGELRLEVETLTLPNDGQRILVYLPADDETARRLDALAGRRPGALHAVAG